MSPNFSMPTLLTRKVNKIMCDGTKIVKQRQLAMRREMNRRGIALKAVAMDSGIKYNTLASYFPEHPDADPVQIPGGAIYSIKANRALPADIISLLDPDGWQAVEIPEGMDLDFIEDACDRFKAIKTQAHHKNSPAGREISDCERSALHKVIPIMGKVG